MPHNLTVLRIHKFHVQVEGAADPVVRDHWGEDLRALHLSFNLVAWKIRTQDLLALKSGPFITVSHINYGFKMGKF